MLSLGSIGRAPDRSFPRTPSTPGRPEHLSAVLVFCPYFCYYSNPSDVLISRGSVWTGDYFELGGVLRPGA